MFNFIKKKVIKNRVQDEILYEYVLNEMEQGIKIKGLWAKAFAHSSGNEGKTSALYMQYRVQSIKDYFTSLQISYEEMPKNKILETLINTKKDENSVANKKQNTIYNNKSEFEKIKCPHCDTSTYKSDLECHKCGVNIRKLDISKIDTFSNFNDKKFVIKNKLNNEILSLCQGNYTIVRKALDLDKNKNCGSNDYLIDKNDFEYLVLRHGGHHIVISNYGIKTQFYL